MSRASSLESVSGRAPGRARMRTSTKSPGSSTSGPSAVTVRAPQWQRGGSLPSRQTHASLTRQPAHAPPCPCEASGGEEQRELEHPVHEEADLGREVQRVADPRRAHSDVRPRDEDAFACRRADIDGSKPAIPRLARGGRDAKSREDDGEGQGHSGRHDNSFARPHTFARQKSSSRGKRALTARSRGNEAVIAPRPTAHFGPAGDAHTQSPGAGSPVAIIVPDGRSAGQAVTWGTHERCLPAR